jgi:hypothetical protein
VEKTYIPRIFPRFMPSFLGGNVFILQHCCTYSTSSGRDGRNWVILSLIGLPNFDLTPVVT